jgi:type IV secretory pathway VirB2 component (pilin)
MSEEALRTMQRSARLHRNASTLDWLRADWPGSEFLTFAGAFAASILLLVLSTDLALAQSVGGAGLEPIDNAAKQLERFLRGPFAKTVMAIAIALTGYVCATGRAPWFWFGLCIIACALIFGAPKIVEFFSQGAN